jgi:cyclopropane fatty-acyl-phospholipid synthase-like methyltransferase
MSHMSTSRAAIAAASGNGAVSNPLMPVLDALSLRFVIWAQAAGGTSLDIGCGDGAATLALLARGCHVVAVDPDAAALHRLVALTPTEQCRRLQVRLGRIPEIDFKLANFAAIYAARVLQLLEPAAVRLSLRKFYRWLYPEGRLFVSALAPLDQATLSQEVAAAGLLIDDAFTYVRPWDDSQECYAVVARCPP